MKQKTLTTLSTGWTDLVLICRKCSKKLDGGYGEEGDETLRRALRDALRRRGRRGDVGLVEVGCLGVCPKSAVTVAYAGDVQNFFVVPKHASADALLDRLLDPTPQPAPANPETGDAHR